MKKENTQQQEKWRELHGISEHERIWVSNLGHIKRVTLDVEDSQSFRKVLYVDGHPIYIDSLVLSLFGTEDSSIPALYGTVDIRYKDGDLTNISPENLEWVKMKYSNKNRTNDDRNLEISRMTVTPDMIASESYPILYDEISDEINSSTEKIDVFDSSINDDKHNFTEMEKVQWRLQQMEYLLKNINHKFPTEKDFDKLSKKISQEIAGYVLDGDMLSDRLRRYKSKWVKYLDVPKGYVVVKKTNPDGSFGYVLVREIAYNIARDVMQRIQAGDEDWKKELHPNPIFVTNPGYSEEEFFKEVDKEIDKKIDTGVLKQSDVQVNDEASVVHKKYLRDEDLRTIKDDHDMEVARQEKLSASVDQIIEELKKIRADEMKALKYKRGDLVTVDLGAGKPVIITDLRNMRELYCPSIRAAANLLGVNREKVRRCVWGHKRQIGPYQVRFKYWGDAMHVLSGIYKDYMELIQKRADDIDNMSDDEFEKLNRELEAMENEDEQIYSQNEETKD